ncbi:MAG: SUMF1/EgtB/PvdO family nonheme iron enzyme, partial [Spirochaetales bacterium]|nr:SUMF1/EgtB/PvdO family nonheme iron enzyme [Spirochaetales bacterium]
MDRHFRHILAGAILILTALCNLPAQSSSGQTAAPFVKGMVLVEGGSFRMGVRNSTNSYEAAHDVTVSSFYICDHEVTVGEFRAYMEDLAGLKTSVEYDGSGYVFRDGTWVKDAQASWKNPGFAQTDEHPVTMVTWMDAIEYCNYLSIMEELDPVYDIDISLDLKVEVKADLSKNGYRLPTEAEWEFAARGGTLSKQYTYIGSNNMDAVSWFKKNSGDTTHPVRQKMPNELGLYDMGGNVYEWCHDWYEPYTAEPAKDPAGPASGTYRVLRGGGWNSLPNELR